MKAILMSIFLAGTSAYAEQIPVNCTVVAYDCYSGPDRQSNCGWIYDIGKLGQIDLSKTGTAPDYEIYEGSTSGKIRQIYDYRFSVYQRRQAQQKFNFLNIEINVNGIVVTGRGENMAEARYFDPSRKFGLGLHCTTTAPPIPSCTPLSE